MADFIKPSELFENSDTVTIQPVTKEGIEQFSIWSVGENKFYNSDDELTIDDKTKKVSDWKFTKMTDDQKNRFRRTLKFLWNVIIDGTEVVYPMPMTVSDKLKSQMTTVEKMDKDPLSFTYTIIRKKTGPKAWNIEYDVVLDKVAEQQALPEPQIEIGLDEEEGIELTTDEAKVVEAIKKQVPDYTAKTVKQLTSVIKKNVGNITPARAEQIVNEFLR